MTMCKILLCVFMSGMFSFTVEVISLKGEIHLCVGVSFCGVMGRWINPFWWSHMTNTRSSRCSTAGVTGLVLYCLWDYACKKIPCC